MSGLSNEEIQSVYELADKASTEQKIVLGQLFQHLADVSVKDQENSISLVLDGYLKSKRNK